MENSELRGPTTPEEAAAELRADPRFTEQEETLEEGEVEVILPGKIYGRRPDDVGSDSES